MYLKSVSIVNYKNIKDVSLALSPKINCLCGLNGVGKTNFLDALHYLSFFRSAFPCTDSQVVRHGQDFFMLQGTYVGEDGEPQEVGCGMRAGKRKHFKRNGKEYRRLSEHIGLVPLIFVSPADTSLIEGAGEARRRLMDMVISQYDARYMASLSMYNKALQQRNAMLRDDREPDPELLGILEERMAEHGTEVFRGRLGLVESLVPSFREIYGAISQGSEDVSLSYVSHCQRGDLLGVIRAGRARDRAVGHSLHGVHRDDLEMLVGGHPARREGSQGQNKTFVVSLKLAEFQVLGRARPGTRPILLLDDVFDRLDARRVERMVRMVSGDGFGQIFLTDTDRGNLDRILRCNLADYAMFRVEGGGISLMEEGHV